jgi:hypothetical protein
MVVGSQAIDIISSESDIHERCVRALSKACGIYELLPDSHKVKSVLRTGQHAVASGGFSDVWKAENEDGEAFAVKVLRMYRDNAVQVKKVYTTRSTLHPQRFLTVYVRTFRSIARKLSYPSG